MSTTKTSHGLLLSGEARELLELGEDIIDRRGRAQIDSFYRVRKLAAALNRGEGAPVAAERLVRPGRLGAVARVDEVSRHIIARYCTERAPGALDQLESWLGEEFGTERLEASLRRFWEAFPSELMRVDGKQVSPTGDAEVFVDLIAVWLLNENPGVGRARQLFADEPLRQDSYEALIERMGAFFDEQPGFGPEGTSLLAMLREPVERGGDTLDAQLDYVRRHWGHLLPKHLLDRLLTTLDVLEEEQKARRFPGGGPGPVEPPSFAGLEGEVERFSDERDWMAEVILLAKNVHVWLTQLSRQHGRDISRLDDIPHEELERLARRGISGLWLIGLWKRSPASERVKELSGSPHVVSSAYSIFEYRVADDLGGEEAWHTLRERARSVGIRMAADMVPNHMGITSKWVYEHPERLLSVDEPPFSSYNFSGPDLSDDPRVGVYLEDHYYDKTDAAVVFKRVDYEHGNTRYIYHGNDGTSMPWNDTAQIDYLNPKAREAVIKQIVEVARRSSIIRFDAAMTLVKRHIQRLWYPEPGSGGAIPSRAERGMSKEDFARAMGREFWTEVVDRVAQEAPDTLLLAEAFWMMEGYFVRSLGMHRVYNSAFMNMLSDEDNAGYRKVIKDTLEFDPEILRRYVNFMNNPDEETAVAQFGRGDKYFGVCTMMATMPGLPMIGHGQIEGFVEKYGMDFNEPRIDEQPDEELVERHRREIFGLLHRRRLFAGVKNFLLYDLYSGNQSVDENVFAYSNRLGDQKALVVYHNKYAETSGWIRDSAAYRDKSVGGDGKLVRKRVVHGLDIEPADGRFVTFRDQTSGLEYIRDTVELAERGFYVELAAYDYHVFVDFEPVEDTDDGASRRLAERLGGGGTPSLVAELRRMELEPVHDHFAEVFSGDIVASFAAGDADQALVDELDGAVATLGAELEDFGGLADVDGFIEEVRCDLEVLLEFETLLETTPALTGAETGAQVHTEPAWAVLVAWALMRPLGGLDPDEQSALKCRALFDEWSLGVVADQLLRKADLDAEDARQRAVQLLRFGLSAQAWLGRREAPEMTAESLLERLVEDDDARAFLGVNEHDGVLWYRGESFDQFVHWLARFGALYAALEAVRAGDTPQIAVPDALRASIEALVEASKTAEYQVGKLMEAVAE